MQARLILLDPPAAKRELNVTVPVTIGRSREARLKLVHSKVSRLHCEFFERDGLLHVRDLGSTNGTYVGDARIEESLVRPGATVTIGAVKFQVLYEPREGALPPPHEFDATDTIGKAGEATFRTSSQATQSKPPTSKPEGAKTQAMVPLSVEEDTLLPLAPSEELPVAPAAAALPVADDESLFILPPQSASGAAAAEPPTDLQWRVPEPTSPVETDFAFQLDSVVRGSPDPAPDERIASPLEPPPQPAVHEQPAKPLSQEDQDFDEFFKSLEKEP